MLKSMQYRRLLWLALVVVLAYCGLGWRLVDLQVFSAAPVRQAYERGAVREYIELPRRGDILDRHGATLTTSVQRFNIGAEPLHVAPLQQSVAERLAGPLQMDLATLVELLTPRKYVAADGTEKVKPFVMLKRGASLEEWKAVRDIMRKSDFGLDLKSLNSEARIKLQGLRRFGVRLDSEYQTREYPNEFMSGQILGYVGNRERRFSIGDPFQEQIGLAGIEPTTRERHTS
jgi:cell division protein FtsI/penicillin-binding protein 2